ncbi:MAG: hypothetical protein AAF936_17550 [Pseudomonadota bacterium]
MTEFEKSPTLVIKATICMRSSEEIGQDKGIMEGFSSSIYFSGNHYPARVVTCESVIMPSHKGQVTLFMLDSFPERSDICAGATFELKNGSLTVAEGSVLSVSEQTD